MGRVALVGCRALPRGDGDDDAVVAALVARGCETEWVGWDDPGNRAADADVVILRATSDYPQRCAEFLRWCESVPGLRNPAAVVRWNTDKSYLLDLAAAGLAIVPTEVVAPGDTPHWPDTDFIVKPATGAGSRGIRRFRADERPAATQHLMRLQEAGYAALVQPYQTDVDVHGETALVFIAGQFSHAFVKRTMLGSSVLEHAQATRAQAPLRAVGERALDAAAAVLDIGRSELLYARVDVVRADNARPLVLELDLVGPSLGLRLAGQPAVARLANAIRALVDTGPVWRTDRPTPTGPVPDTRWRAPATRCDDAMTGEGA